MTTNHVNGLTNAQIERLALLAEECAEVSQMIGKILRYGYQSTHPKGGPDNRERLTSEIIDVLWVLDMMIDEKDVFFDDLEERLERKTVRSNPYLRYNFMDAERFRGLTDS